MRAFISLILVLIALATFSLRTLVPTGILLEEGGEAYFFSNAALALKFRAVDRLKYGVFKAFEAAADATFPAEYGVYGCTGYGCDINNLSGSGCPNVVSLTTDPYQLALSNVSRDKIAEETEKNLDPYPLQCLLPVSADLNISLEALQFSAPAGTAQFSLYARVGKFSDSGTLNVSFSYDVNSREETWKCICDGVTYAEYKKTIEELVIRLATSTRSWKTSGGKVASFYTSVTFYGTPPAGSKCEIVP